MDDLADSTSLLTDAEGLRARLARDGYLFFRGLLPVGDVGAAAEAVAEQLRVGGWLTGDGIASSVPRATRPGDTIADPAYRRAAISAAFNRIPYLPPLRDLVRRVLGEQAFSYPMKVLRAVYPERHARALGRFVHYDYGVAGVQDMLTTWVPLMDIPVSLGGLAVSPGGHLRPPGQAHLLCEDEQGWATTDYYPGDVVVFHCMIPHAALPNSTSLLRLSGDFRWQRSDQPVPLEMVNGPGTQQRELFSPLFKLQPWWEPVPSDLSLFPKDWLISEPPGQSRFFAVHPDWRNWQPPLSDGLTTSPESGK